MPEDIVDLILESSGQHLVSLIQHKLLDITGPEHKKGFRSRKGDCKKVLKFALN